MLFVTNRRFKQGPSESVPDGAPTPPPRKVDFDLADSEPASAVHFCERMSKVTARPVLATV